MNYKERYENFINELEADFLQDGTLQDDDILILREEEAINGYFPILDWSFDAESMNEYYTEQEKEAHLLTEKERAELINEKTEFVLLLDHMKHEKVSDILQELREKLS